MIRFRGEDIENGETVLGVTLSPEEMARLVAGQEIALNIQRMAPDAIAKPMRLLISYASDYEAASAAGIKQATADGAEINVIPVPSTRVQ